MSEEGGVWRTVGGRRIFIKDGDDLETAMKNSGKFSSSQSDEDDREDKLESLQGEFWTRFEELQSDVEATGVDVEELNEENMTISYEEDGDDIQALYEINTVYRNDKPSTITIGKRKRIEVL